MPVETQEPKAASTSGEDLQPVAVAQTLALIKPWVEHVPPRQRRLGLFIFVALLAHLSIFLFIKIDMTRSEWRHQPHSHVSLETGQEATSLISRQPHDVFWDRLTDPRLFLLPDAIGKGTAPDDTSFDFAAPGNTIAEHEMPAAAIPPSVPLVLPASAPVEQRVGDSMNPARQPFRYTSQPVRQSGHSAWDWDEVLSARHPVLVPALPSPVSDTELTPTQIRLAVDAAGNVIHTVLVQSAGQNGASVARDLDQAALRAAAKLRFRSVTDQTAPVWGRATIYWNYSARPRVEVQPTPPSSGN